MNRNKLVEIAESEGVRSDAFALDGPGKRHQYILTVEPGGWAVYFVERDEHLDVRHFDSEDGACEHLLSLLLRDGGTREQYQTRADVEHRLAEER